MGGQIITDIYSVKSTDVSSSDIENGFLNGRKAVVNTNNQQLKEVNRLTALKRKETGLPLPEMKEMRLPGDAAKAVIKRVTVRGEKNKVQSAADQLGGKLESIQGQQENVASVTESILARIFGIGTAYAGTTWDALWRVWTTTTRGTITTGRTKNPEKWIPEMGYSYIGAYTNNDTYKDDRYSYQLMWWDDASDLKPAGTGWWGTDGYEHKVFLYNYDGKTFMKNAGNIYGQPSFTYAASNLPNAYVDTRLADVSGEVAFTIGSGRGDLIHAYTSDWYWTQFFTDPGNDTVDKFKLQSRPATEYYSNCYYTWGTFCMFGDTSVPVKTLISFPSGNNVPTGGWVSWRY